jgi:protoheme IX farnesyltransferase
MLKKGIKKLHFIHTHHFCPLVLRFSTTNEKNIQTEGALKNNISVKNILIHDTIQKIEMNKEIITIQKKDVLKLFSEITKFKLSFLNTSVAITSYFFFANLNYYFLSNFFLFAGGTMCISMTSQVINQIMEINYDKMMKRTQNRPLPKNRISVSSAKKVAFALWSTSTIMFSIINPQAILFPNGILLLYVCAYTPLKRVNNSAMHIGAVVGCLPALLGSFAATNVIFLEEAFLLAGYIAAWQYPHFYGILYNNKEDYKAAGFKFISNYNSKNIYAYLQIIVSMAVMAYIVYRLNKKGIMNNFFTLAFSYYFLKNLKAIYPFIYDTKKHAKRIIVTSYAPFLIVLLSYFFYKLNTYKNPQLIKNEGMKIKVPKMF